MPRPTELCNPEFRGIEEPGARHMHYGKEGTTKHCLACKTNVRDSGQKLHTSY